MSNKNAILLFHASQLGNNLHPFLVNETSRFQAIFENVYVICLDAKCGFSEIEKYNNVHVISIGLHRLYSKLWYLIPELFSKYFWKDLRLAVSNRIFDMKYLKITAMQVICGRYFSKIMKRLIAQKIKSEWVVESYWLTGTAYAAARIKKDFPDVIAFSRLHSSESDYIRNKYAVCQLKGFVDKYLDYIFFVSENGKTEYESIMKKYYHKFENDDKYIVNRLGVNKTDHDLSPVSSDDQFRVLSCSRMTSLKRVPILADIMAGWKGRPVEWTHIGDGEDYQTVQKIVRHAHGNAKCKLLGSMSNTDVINYYKNNAIDLFINISQYEGLPVSIMEALSFGVPVLATDAGGTREIVSGRNGYLLSGDFCRENVENAIDYLTKLLPKDRSVLRAEAYRTYMRLLDADRNFKDLMDIICKEQ